MKYKSSALLALIITSSVQASDLVITGVIDGPLSGGTPKAVEIFVLNDIADLSACGLGSANNGGGSDGQEYTFNSGPATAGSYIYISSESSNFEAYLGFQPTDTAGAVVINGDDGVELFCDGVVVDTFGDINVDGNGEAWEYLDGWAYRTANTGPDGATFVLGSWSFSGANALDGETSNASATSVFPLKNFAEGEEIDPIGEGDDTGTVDSNVISGSVCTNCPDVPKIKDASLFDATNYYAAAQAEINFNSSVSTIKLVLSDIIATDHKNLSYSDVWTALTYTDEDPTNTDNVILWYSNRSQGKATNGSGAASSDPDNWNREHSWAKSHGFPSDSFEAYTDIHHLRPTDISINSSRGNLDFDNSDSPLAESPINSVDSDSFEPRDDIKGDVARMMFYMDTRYEGTGSDSTPDLELVNRITTTSESKLGLLCTLVAWNAADPIDASEELRNNRIYELQGNRNPYIDNPAWVEMIYPSAGCGIDGGDDGTDDGDDGTDSGDDGTDTGTVVSSDIIISGVIDGSLSGGTPKAIELHIVNDIADLSVCGLGSANNGGGSDGQEFTFDAISANSGDFIYVASETTGFNTFFGFAPDYTAGMAAINGDDAVELYCDDEVVDTFGDINVDGNGEAWEYLDGWAYRNANTGPDGSDFVLANWTFSGPNALDGASANSSTDLAFPIGTFYVDEKLVITGVADASLSGGTPKVIEFYAATDIEDLSIFGFGSANNGGGSDGQEYTFSGSASKGDYIYIASESTNFEVFFGFAPTDTTSVAGINGDDAVELFKNGEVVDVFGDINTDGNGEAWEYLDGWAYRVSGTGPDGATFTLENWSFSGINVLDGQSTNDTATTPFPIASFSGNGAGTGDGGDDNGSTVSIGMCADEATLISAVQGNGFISPLVDETILVEGIVSASFSELTGFFVQEEVADMDTDSLTSEGIFVYYEGVLPTVGDVVRVVGDVAEYYERTQIVATEILTGCGTGSAIAASLSLPFSSSEEVESLEGMLVSSAQNLVVTDNYYLSRYGEATLSSKRLYNPTNLYSPGSVEAVALEAANALDKITLDDGVNGSNPESVPYPTGGLSAGNSLRSGDTVLSLTGVMDYSFDKYRVIPTASPSFAATNVRESEPSLSLGNIKVASLNVLNYFVTLDDGAVLCGPSASLDCRGANDAVEFERQKAKTVSAIVAMDADVVGLMEIENNGFGTGSAIADLVSAINDVVGTDTYSIVDPGTTVGTDAITVALIYKSSVVTLNGALKILDSSNSISDEDGALFVDTKNRPALAQEFSLVENGEAFVVSVNHFKSKGSSCGASDDDTTTGQGSCNLTRTRAAQALSAFLDTQFPDTATLIIGDLNSYAKEDPISALEQSGYTNLVNYFGGATAYSYSFDGQVGYLDHALGNNKALAKVVDVTEWHINADEPIALDYNIEFKADAHITDFYAADAYRMSDHDPVVIALQFDAVVDETPETNADVNRDGSVDFSDYMAIIGMLGSVTGDTNFDAIADFDEDGAISAADLQVWYQLYLGQ